MIELFNEDCMDVMARYPDDYFELAIVDPPYFEVKGQFDFMWNSFDDYLTDVDKWAKELNRVLAKNGSLYWYGHAKKIAYSQCILDRYFNLENSLVWNKYDSQTNKGADDYRCYAPVTERILFYSKEVERTGLEEIKLNTENFKPLRNYFEGLQKSLLSTKTKILNEIGGRADHCFRWGSTQWEMPTEQTYKKILSYGVENFKVREYESLRLEYESLRRPFNNDLKLTDVMRFSQEAHITGRHDHPTQKPPKLTQAIVRTSGVTGGNALIPFVGSGTEAVECVKFGMNVVGAELDKDYFDAAQERIERETAQKALF